MPDENGEFAVLFPKLKERYRGLEGRHLLRRMLREALPGRVALVSSFGTEAAILLDLVAEIDRATPVIFLDTGNHFSETLAYVEHLVSRFGLTDLRRVRPDPVEVARHDPENNLWRYDADACCQIRKVWPLDRVLSGFDGWISGIKRYHGGGRVAVEPLEFRNGRIKINPLARWTQKQVRTAFAERNLPAHPLEARGFASLGCLPCTRPVGDGDDPRAGRWPDLDKTECGIHEALAGSSAPGPKPRGFEA